jgi:hypothetical protein
LHQTNSEFVQEYEDLGHMNQINEEASNIERSYYLPHYADSRSSSSTARTPVIFDGSYLSISGLSLNDALLVGPTIQKDLNSIVFTIQSVPNCIHRRYSYDVPPSEDSSRG